LSQVVYIIVFLYIQDT